MNYDEVSDQIIKKICDCGWKAYLCGGAIRDAFMEFEPNDYDIVTEATPEELSIIFSDRKVKTVGVNFLVTLIDDIEVSTYRSDKNYKPGRNNCITEVCETLDQDLQRRDFTFNAMAVCPYTGEVVDPFNGRKDLEKRIVKFVGDPEQRIYEDYLRIIRAARFACLIEGRLHQETFNAICKYKHLVLNISPERIRLELLKVMKYRRPSIFFDILYQTGILKILFPELDRMYNHTGGIHHGETLDAHFKITGDSLSSRDPLLRLIGYFHDIGKPPAWDFNDDNFINHENLGSFMIKNVFDKYKFSTKETQTAVNLIKFHMRSFDCLTTEKAARRLLRVFSENNVSWKNWLKLKVADKKANLSKKPYKIEHIKNVCLKIHNCQKQTGVKEFKLKDLNISGHDIMNKFQLKPGPTVGMILRNLFDIVIDDPSLNKKERLLEIIKVNNMSLLSVNERK